MAIMRVPERPGGRIVHYEGGDTTATPGRGASARLAPLSDAAARIGGNDVIGAQIAALGGAVTRAAVAGNALYMDYQRARAQEALNAYQQEAIARQAELDSLQGENALGKQGVQAQLVTWQRDARARLTKELGEPARRFFDLEAAETDARLNAWAVRKTDAENRAWQDSVDKGSILTAQQMAVADPSLMGEAAGQIKAALVAMGRRNGWDDSLVAAKFHEAEQGLWKDVTTQQISGLLQQGDTAGARAVLAAVPGRGGSIAEDFRNPLNLKRVGANTGTRADFRVFKDYAEGFRAAHDQIKRYYNRDGLTTPRQIIAKWAPAADGNDLGRYATTLQAAGIAPDTPLDVNDAAQAAKLMKGMALAESPVGKMFSADQIERMLTTGKMPEERQETRQAEGRDLMAPTDRMALENMIASVEKKQQQEQLLDFAQSIAAQVRSLPKEEREAAAFNLLDGIGNLQARREMLGVVNDQLRFLDARDEADTALRVKEMANQIQQERLDPIGAAKLLEESGMSGEARAATMDRAFGKIAENAENRAALDKLRAQIDRKEITDKAGIEVAGMNARMTNEQIKAAMEYLDEGGKLGGATISGVTRKYKMLSGKSELPEGFYDVVVSKLPDGKKPSEKELENIISNLIMDDGGWLFKDTLFDAIREKREAKWLPVIDDADRERIAPLVEQEGLKPTDENIRAYKKSLLMGTRPTAKKEENGGA